MSAKNQLFTTVQTIEVYLNFIWIYHGLNALPFSCINNSTALQEEVSKTVYLREVDLISLLTGIFSTGIFPYDVSPPGFFQRILSPQGIFPVGFPRYAFSTTALSPLVFFTAIFIQGNQQLKIS